LSITWAKVGEDEPESAASIAPSQNNTQPPIATSTQFNSDRQLIKQLTQQLSQLAQQNQLLQQQLTQLLSLQSSPQQVSPSSQSSKQCESTVSLESDLDHLALLLAVNNQLESKSASPSE
jgi:hypothetical protein